MERSWKDEELYSNRQAIWWTVNQAVSDVKTDTKSGRKRGRIGDPQGNWWGDRLYQTDAEAPDITERWNNK